MKIITPSFYKNFKCIAGDCPDSCCQGWEVDADDDSLAYYSTLDASLDIKKKIDTVLDKDEFGNTVFSLAAKKRCPFLNSENLCDMHIAIGGEHTPVTCRNFPRFIYDFGGTREIGISFSCPVAADIMYNLDVWTFDEAVNSELPVLNDIDAEKYIKLRELRSRLYSVIQNRNLDINQRIVLALDLCKELNTDEKIIDTIDFFDAFRNPELINPEWEAKVNNACVKDVENSTANENIAMYFIYKYFLSSVLEDEYNPYLAVKMAAVGILINTYFGSDSWTVHLWSKETEHSQYNMTRYKRLLNTAECFSAEALKSRFN